MTPALTLHELLEWNNEVSQFWKAHLEAHPELLELPCGIGGAATVQDLIRHIWAVELRWAQRLSGVPEMPKEAIPAGPLHTLFDLHIEGSGILRRLLADPAQDWEADYTLAANWLPADKRTLSRRKVLGHALLHGQRHWAQLATLLRSAGYPSGFGGDLLFSSALR